MRADHSHAKPNSTPEPISKSHRVCRVGKSPLAQIQMCMATTPIIAAIKCEIRMRTI